MRRQDLQGKKEEDAEGEEAGEVVLGAGEESHLLNDRSWYLIEDGHHLQGRWRLRPLLKNMAMHWAPG
jgi:hypothetical protein